MCPQGGHKKVSSIGIYFWWTNDGAKRPGIEGVARTKGVARTEGEAREKNGGRGLLRGLGEPLPRKFLKKTEGWVWGGGSVSPSPGNF